METEAADLYPAMFKSNNHEIEQEPRETVPLESQTVGRESARKPWRRSRSWLLKRSRETMLKARASSYCGTCARR